MPFYRGSSFLTAPTLPVFAISAVLAIAALLVRYAGISIPLIDRALEIWTLWDRAVGPRSVGLIDAPRSVRLNLRDLPKPGPNQLFEITLEPASGSPTGRPTGPILMKGTTAAAL